jgi:hypothetical protein
MTLGFAFHAVSVLRLQYLRADLIPDVAGMDLVPSTVTTGPPSTARLLVPDNLTIMVILARRRPRRSAAKKTNSHSSFSATRTRTKKRTKTEMTHNENNSSGDGILVVEQKEDADADDAYWEVDTVIARRKRKGKEVEYRIRWKGCSHEQDSWEPESSLCDTALNEAQRLPEDKTRQARKRKVHVSARSCTNAVKHQEPAAAAHVVVDTDPAAKKLHVTMCETESEACNDGVEHEAPPAKLTQHPESSSAGGMSSSSVVETTKESNPMARRRQLRGDPILEDGKNAFDYNPGVLSTVVSKNENEKEPSQPCRELTPSTGHLFAGAIPTPQAQLGIELLTQLLVSHNYIPNETLTRKLYETVIYGPKSEGTYYPDPRKLELILNYLTGACRQNVIMRNALIDIATSQWSVIEETLCQVTADIYRFPGDHCLADNAALTRISSSLQVAASGLNLLLELMKYQIDQKDKIRQEPVMRAFRECEGGLRGALKYMTRMNAIAWTRHGHFLIAENGKTLSSHFNNIEPTIVQSCSKQARKVLQTLAKLTSYTAWMYSLDQGLNMKKKSFCSTIVDVLNSEWSTMTEVDVDPYYQSERNTSRDDIVEKYLEKMKLRFALDLTLVDEEWSGPFHLVVADLFGLRQKYKHLFD